MICKVSEAIEKACVFDLDSACLADKCMAWTKFSRIPVPVCDHKKIGKEGSEIVCVYVNSTEHLYSQGCGSCPICGAEVKLSAGEEDGEDNGFCGMVVQSPILPVTL